MRARVPRQRAGGGADVGHGAFAGQAAAGGNPRQGMVVGGEQAGRGEPGKAVEGGRRVGRTGRPVGWTDRLVGGTAVEGAASGMTTRLAGARRRTSPDRSSAAMSMTCPPVRRPSGAAMTATVRSEALSEAGVVSEAVGSDTRSPSGSLTPSAAAGEPRAPPIEAATDAPPSGRSRILVTSRPTPRSTASMAAVSTAGTAALTGTVTPADRPATNSSICRPARRSPRSLSASAAPPVPSSTAHRNRPGSAASSASAIRAVSRARTSRRSGRRPPSPDSGLAVMFRDRSCAPDGSRPARAARRANSAAAVGASPRSWTLPRAVRSRHPSPKSADRAAARSTGRG